MRILLALLFCFLMIKANADEEYIALLPQKTPVPVETHFYLSKLVSIDEKTESFTANAIFVFKWQDSHLAFKSADPTPKIYIEEMAVDKLKKIWWPQLEFLNADHIEYTNRSLFISPDGSVEYYVGLKGTFHSDLDFSRFPFDKQILTIKIDSFLWDDKIMYFVSSPEEVKPNLSENGIQKEQKILEIKSSIASIHAPGLQDFEQGKDFSTYEINITIQREYGFFLYQVFVPLFLVLGIALTVLFAYKEPFLDRIAVSLPSFLIFIAAKFTINQDLPKITYMTIIDKAFALSYLCIGLIVIISVLQKLWAPTHEERARKLDVYARFLIPSFFIITLIYLIVYSRG